jgi:hypothetical protein
VSSKSKRGPKPPPRPQLINEQMRREINAHVGNRPKILSREECMQFVVMLAANLQGLLANKAQLPWVTTSIDKRSDGFSLHVQVVQPTTETDAQVVG